MRPSLSHLWLLNVVFVMTVHSWHEIKRLLYTSIPWCHATCLIPCKCG